MSTGTFTIPLPAEEKGPVCFGAKARTRAPILPHFIGGDENRLAGVAVSTLLAGGLPFYNPMFFSGPPGTGKSSLVRSLAAGYQSRHPAATVVFTAGRDFARPASQPALSTPAGRQDFPRPNFLVVDDIEPLTGHPAAQNRFCRMLDDLVARESQVVVTAPAPPFEMPGLSAATCSRLSAGLLVQLALPGDAARRAVLVEYAKLHGIRLSTEAAVVLASKLKVTVAELCDALAELAAQTRSGQSAIEGRHARRYLADRNTSRVVPIRRVATAVARHCSLPLADLQSASRRRSVVAARDMAMYLAWRLCGKSLKAVGRFFGGRDHSTVLHGCRKIEAQLAQDASVRRVVAQLRLNIEG